MARKTRQTSKLREAEGIPPSPPTELPTELSGTRRSRKKKTLFSTQTLITSETDEGASSATTSSSQQHQSVPDQTLREGNAGGYIVSPRSSPSYIGLVHQGVPNSTTPIKPTAVVQSVSTQTDGLAAPATFQVADRIELSRRQEITCDAAVQTETRLQPFKPLFLYAYNNALQALPDFCSVTLHLDGGREIRISEASAITIRTISDILQRDPTSWYERNWLTPQEIAEAEAKAKAESERQQQSAGKRKRNEDTEMPQAQKRRITPSPTPSANMTRRVRFMQMNRSGPGRSLAAMRADPLGEGEADPYNEDGELQLFDATPSFTLDDDRITNEPIAGPSTQDIGTPDEASRGDEQSPPPNEGTSAPDTQDSGVESAQIDEQPSQMPQTGSWRLGSLVNSVSRYVPGFSWQRRRLAAPQISTTPIARDRNQAIAQTEPRRPATMAGHSDFATRLQNSHIAAKKTFRTKENIEAMKKLKAEKEKIKEEWANLAEQRRIAEQEKLEIAESKRITELEKLDIEDAHRAAFANQQPGSKRQRVSPRVIPNPKGVSYGFDPAYFCVDDDSEEEEVEASSPSRKTRRISGPDHSSSTTPMAKTQISPSAPALHTSPSGRATEYNGSHFSESPPNVFAQATVPSRPVPTKNDPNFNHAGHFEVPWSPVSSDEDSDEESAGEKEVSTPVVDKSPPSSTTHPSTGNDSYYAAPASSPPKSAMASSPPKSATASFPPKSATTSSPPKSVTASSLPKSATASMIPPVTPAPKRVFAAPEAKRDPEAAKTLERNRQLLRAKMAGKNKSVLSPKDIQNPNKVQVPSQAATQPTPQLTNDGIFFQPQPTATGPPAAPANDNGFGFLGAANQKAPKSPARMLAETLPSVQDKLNKLQSYNAYQQAMDPRVSQALESSWKEADETTAGNHFSSRFKEFSEARKQDSAELAKPPQSRDFRQASDDEATDDEDHASLYEDEDNNVHKEQEIHADDGLFEETNEDDEGPSEESEEDNSVTPPLTALPTAFRNYSMDPAVAAYLKEQWTAEDEAYAGDEFMTQLSSSFHPTNFD
ncbi:MAG: hypothetical protein Q9182_006121 [Xanthomendoza sp. 2 TL-2023]